MWGKLGLSKRPSCEVPEEERNKEREKNDSQRAVELLSPRIRGPKRPRPLSVYNLSPKALRGKASEMKEEDEVEKKVNPLRLRKTVPGYRVANGSFIVGGSTPRPSLNESRGHIRYSSSSNNLCCDNRAENFSQLDLHKAQDTALDHKLEFLFKVHNTHVLLSGLDDHLSVYISLTHCIFS